MDKLESIQRDYNEWKERIDIEKKKYFDLAFKSFIRDHEGKSVEEVRKIILDLEEQAHHDRSLFQIEFSREFRVRFDKHVEGQIVVIEEV